MHWAQENDSTTARRGRRTMASLRKQREAADPEPQSFTGFGPEALQYFHELAMDQDQQNLLPRDTQARSLSFSVVRIRRNRLSPPGPWIMRVFPYRYCVRSL